VFGKSSGFVSDLDLSDLDGNNGFWIEGEAAGDKSGTSVATGLFNADYVKRYARGLLRLRALRQRASAMFF
jgi:hypothetical protein